MTCTSFDRYTVNDYKTNLRFLRLILILLIICTSFAYEKFINCGAAEPCVLYDRTWEADIEYEPGGAGYILGESHATLWQLGGTRINNVLFQKRIGADEYLFDVPNGGYVIQLNMFEYYIHGINQRVIDISIEDSLVLNNFDILKFAEKDYALKKTFYIQVEDSVLNITFTPLVGESNISGIAVYSTEPDTIAPLMPDWITNISSYHANVISWAENVRDFDIDGHYVYRFNDSTLNWDTLTPTPTCITRFIDRDVDLDTEYQYAVSSIDVFGNEGPMRIASGTNRPYTKGETDVPIFDLFISDSCLDLLNRSPFSDDYIRGDFMFCDSLWADVRIRYRGGFTRNLAKKNFKINFDREERFFGTDKLNFNGESADASFIKTLLGLNLFRMSNIDASYAKYASLWLNNDFYGAFQQLEQVDEKYLDDRHYNEDDFIYKNKSSNYNLLEDYSRHWEIETGESDDFSHIQTFCEILHWTPDTNIENTLDSILDVEKVLSYYAVITLIDDNDYTVHNHYLHRVTETGKWHIIPWDLNLAFTNSELPLGSGSFYEPFNVIIGPNIFLTRLMGINSYRNRYCDLLDSLSSTLFSPSTFAPLVDSLKDHIRTDVYADYRKGFYEYNRGWEDQTNLIRDNMETRMEFIRSQIEDFREFENPTGICINELCLNNDSIFADEWGDFDSYIELYNKGDEPFNIGDLYLTNEPYNQKRFRLPLYELAPNDRVLIWLDGEPDQGIFHSTYRFSSLNTFFGLFDARDELTWFSYLKAIDLLFFPRFTNNESWQRFPDGENLWSFAPPTPYDNNVYEITEPLLPTQIAINTYPNPFNSSFTIEAPKESTIQIFDIRGKLIQEKQMSGTSVFIEFDDNSPSGLYLVNISSDGNTYTKPIVFMK